MKRKGSLEMPESGRDVLVTREDWEWLLGHASRNTDPNGVDRWICKKTKGRIYVRFRMVKIEDPADVNMLTTIADLVCPQCKVFGPTHLKLQASYSPKEIESLKGAVVELVD